MLFNSFEFLLIFLPVVLGCALLLRGNALLFWIALASCAFYAFAGHAWFLIPMAISTTLDFWVGQRIGASKNHRVRRAYLILSLTANLGLLAYFKYSGLIARTIEAALQTIAPHSANAAWVNLFRVVLPAGISFYTFQTISYVIDIYRDESPPERNFLKYLSFVAFFPHLVAGPLTRHNQLIPQLTRIADRGISPRWRAGLMLFAVGLAKKVLIADRVGNAIDPVIAAIDAQGFASSWLVLFGYSVQIYFDFSGYSDMAIGLGRLFAVELPQNFNSPYQATSPSDFWTRWHITLSRWLRDYLYIPLGGNRKGEFRTKLNLMVTMVLGGLWHGANWTFALWGLFHGLLLWGYHATGPRWDEWPIWYRRVATYLLVTLAWVFFRAPTLQTAGHWFAGLAGWHGIGGIHALAPHTTFLILAAVIASMTVRNVYEREIDTLSLFGAGVLGAVAGVALVMMNYSSKFLYFQF
ncbi:MAG: MBOAT family O-acyltransferase [Gemmatimonadaceae bacterium]